MTIEYAMYRGDEFIDIGTIDELADKYYKKRENSLYWLHEGFCNYFSSFKSYKCL